MIRWKALSKVYLVLAYLLCFSAYNTPARAGQFDNITFGDGSDLTAIAQWWVNDMGGSIDDYFYSEVYSTGSDGSLGNEYICLRDDVNQTYIGRSDVCVNRANDANYSYIQIDKMDWTAKTPDTLIGQTGDIIGDNNWSGCYNYSPSPSWAGTSGGQCPNVNTSSFQINWGYVEQTLSTIGAINDALRQAGVEVTGYNYSWRVKNADANYEDTNGTRGQDPLTVTLEIRDTTGKTVFSKTYDYSYWIDTWTYFSGTETFANPLMGENLSEIELSVTGKDAGYWAGWYGPEFDDPVVKLNFRYANPIADTTIEDTMFNNKCTSDPLSDPLCPGYNDAMIAQINNSSTIQNITATEPVSTTNTTNIVPTPVAEVTSTGEPKSEATGTADPVAEAAATSEPVAESIAEVSETTVTETTTTVTSNEEKKATGLNSTQLNALNAASAVANSAIGSATDAANESAGVGLDANGGVGSALTSVDPTGSTNAFGQQNDIGAGGSNDGTGSADGTGVGTNIAGTVDSTSLNSDALAGDSTSQNSLGETTNQDFDVSQVEQSVVGESISQAEEENNKLTNSSLESAEENVALATNSVDSSTSQTFKPGNPIDELIKEMTAAIIQAAVDDAQDVAEESSQESYEDQNSKEDALVEEAQSGSDDEDAKAALLGYNPKIRAYQQEQVYGGKDIYANQGMYEDQKTYDNPNARLFNGASDALHREMVRSQYER